MDLAASFRSYLCDRIEQSGRAYTSPASVLVAEAEFCAKYPLSKGLEYMAELTSVSDEQWLRDCGYVPVEQPSCFARAVQKA